MKSSILIVTLLTCLCFDATAQNIGINTQNPVRRLDVYGADDQFVRIQTTTDFATETGVELINGTPNDLTMDWKVSNDIGTFSFIQSTDNFNTKDAILKISAAGNIGIRAPSINARLHINNGIEASNTDHGFMVIGSTAAINMVMDQNEINVRSNGAPSSLFLQEQGGPVMIGIGGGDVFFGTGGGNVGIGTGSAPKKLTVSGTGFQTYLRNTGSNNAWYIGASNSSWVAGDNQLLFSPTATSNDAVFRLMDVSENDGVNAPVIIRSSASQELLIDGNEFDSKHGPLYINHNSDQNTIFNTAGGNVGIGTNSTGAKVHVYTPNSTPALRLQVPGLIWQLQPNDVSGHLMFTKSGVTLAQINTANGQYIALSDRKLKTDLEPLSSVLDGVRSLGLYSYNYMHDAAKTSQFGVLAQEVVGLFPEVIHYQDEEYMLSYAQLAVIALKALQEQQAQIDILQEELQSLLR